MRTVQINDFYPNMDEDEQTEQLTMAVTTGSNWSWCDFDEDDLDTMDMAAGHIGFEVLVIEGHIFDGGVCFKLVEKE